jgi:hypothetical protein
MGVVMIKCPRTGRAISTGMTADRDTFRSSAVFFARAYCAICQANHEWFAREAWVDEPRRRSRDQRATMYETIEALKIEVLEIKVLEKDSARRPSSRTSWAVTGRAKAPRVSPRLLRFG